MSYTFLPWLRDGIASDVIDVAGDRAAPHLDLVVNGVPITPELPVRLLGPGEVTGIAPEQVIRTDPVDGATAVPPNYFPLVEFDEPALPWLFSPGEPDQGRRLRPWVVLVVVRRQPGVTLETDPQLRVSVLTIAAPAVPSRELPDLAESWAWAHVQVTGSAPGGALRQVLATEPRRSLARLLCPRRLDRLTAYVACVVPAHAGGRAAGLGEPEAADPHADAWTGADALVRLPVYHHWEFVTGEAGDFEALAARLSGSATIPPGVGTRVLDLTGSGIPVPPGVPGTLAFEGALRPVGAPAGAGPVWFGTALAALLRQADARTLVPPTYGSQQAGSALPPAGWMQELNVDPRHRAAAGLGVQFVRDEQERLVELAWKQVGELDDTNRFLARSQLGDAVAQAVWQNRFTALAVADAAALLQTAAVARLPGGDLVSRARADTGVPEAVLSAAYRRLTRPRGPLARRSGMPMSGASGLVQPGGIEMTQVMSELDPAITRRARLAALIVAPPEMGLMSRPDPAAPVIRPPLFTAPLVTELLRMSAEHVLPGAEHIPADTVLVLEPNRRFVAAFLAGANHELSRELLWREFPTDLTATYFPVFWDRRGHLPPDADPQRDIRPIAQWAPADPLGAGVLDGGNGIVLVVRGELLRRYPRADVLAVRAVWDGNRRVLADEGLAGSRELPLFSGFLEPDTTFFGFRLSAAEIRGDLDGLGWFLVLQEQPTEPRFGLDEVSSDQFAEPPPQPRPDGTSAPALPSARLGWGHVTSEQGLATLTHVPVVAGRPAGWWFPDRPRVSWTGGSADLAVLTLQRPSRIALHGRRLLGPP
ncbi:hypothetical protein [Blastococcus deserti]|uniref:Uncharacterized protein n=1 Tax=Blastococcus deserti TaxID=2259033 RepID=A0ABW4XDC8_9ACTN